MSAKPKASNAPTSGYWLNREKDESEYDQIYYYLRASTFGASIGKFEVWKIQNLEFAYQYQNRSKSLQKLASWTNARKLDSEKNKLELVCDQGFSFDSGGMEFQTGVIEVKNFRSILDTETTAAASAERSPSRVIAASAFQLLLCPQLSQMSSRKSYIWSQASSPISNSSLKSTQIAFPNRRLATAMTSESTLSCTAKWLLVARSCIAATSSAGEAQ
jgi:hypothetical protein